MRGQREDYDEWARLTRDARWSWEAVLPAFKQTEDYYGCAGESHGSGGEWRIEKQRLNWAVLDSFSQAAQQLGIPATDDFNRGDNTGIGYFDVNQRRGWRLNTSKAFLRPIRHRRNLRIITGAHACRLVIAQRRCSGVEYVGAGGRVVAHARREVLLAAGAINSPQLLELSGIGDGSRLRGSVSPSS
jgi:choline dehydrogenase